MTRVRRPGLDSRASAAWLAAVAFVILTALVMLSFPFIHGHSPEVSVLLVSWLSAAVAAVALAGLLPWDRLPREALLLVPLLLGSVLEISGRYAPAVSAAYSPMFVVVFVFAGLTQRRFVSPLLVPPTVIAWLDTLHHRVDDQSIVRLLVQSAIWVLVAEVLAWRMAGQSRVRAELSAYADRDALTGLDNRGALSVKLADPIVDCAVIMIDIDHFKDLNDTFGHLEGDHVLADFAHVLAAVLRSGDAAFRYGGEEFVVLAPHTGLAGAQRLLGRVRKAWQVARPEVTFSAGVAAWQPGEDSEAVLGRADAALYRAKAAGRDCWRVSDAITSSPAVPAPRAATEPATDQAAV
jgi:diguanylate cyclase (GGDEF)-like protein